MSKLSIVIMSACFFFFVAIGSVHASQSEGTISTSEYRSLVCKNAVCSDFGNINWRPTGATPIVISDNGISGYAWGDEIGWINFDLEDTAVTIDETTGVLSGYAFANSGGWINFNPTRVAGGEEVGVSIDENGKFVGWAWVSGANGGWMKFDCAAPATCVSTDWRPIGQRDVIQQKTSSSSGRSILRNSNNFINQNIMIPALQTLSDSDVYRIYDLVKRILELVLQIEKIKKGVEIENATINLSTTSIPFSRPYELTSLSQKVSNVSNIPKTFSKNNLIINSGLSLLVIIFSILFIF
jgi:hypothetical protein